MEPETNENSLREGKRLEAEAETLKPLILESGKEISYTCLPTMVDGKGTIYILRQQKNWVYVWVLKMASFANVQYYVFIFMLWGGSEKVHFYAVVKY